MSLAAPMTITLSARIAHFSQALEQAQQLLWGIEALDADQQRGRRLVLRYCSTAAARPPGLHDGLGALHAPVAAGLVDPARRSPGRDQKTWMVMRGTVCSSPSAALGAGQHVGDRVGQPARPWPDGRRRPAAAKRPANRIVRVRRGLGVRLEGVTNSVSASKSRSNGSGVSAGCGLMTLLLRCRRDGRPVAAWEPLAVAVVAPCRYLSRTVWRRCASGASESRGCSRSAGSAIWAAMSAVTAHPELVVAFAVPVFGEVAPRLAALRPVGLVADKADYDRRVFVSRLVADDAHLGGADPGQSGSRARRWRSGRPPPVRGHRAPAP